MSWAFLLIVIFLALWLSQVQGVRLGAPGLYFFRYVIYANAIFITLLGISYFSSVISEEKEEDTLGLMSMAGISPLGILLGKSTTRLFQIFLLLAVQYPFTLLAVTLGGLLPDQIYGAYAALFSYTLLLANVGLLCSILCRRSRDAAGLTTLWLVGYVLAPILALLRLSYLGSTASSSVYHPLLVWLTKTCVFGELYSITETGYQFTLSPQLISNSIGGLLLFFLSWWCFGIVSHEPATEATTRAMVPRKSGRFGRLSAGRAWNFALVWKDFHFTTGGWAGIVVRCLLYTGLYWLSFAATYPWRDPGYARYIQWYNVTWGFQVFVVPLFAIDCAMCVGRVYQEEIRHQTLAALLMLPRSVVNIVYSKLAGCLFGLIPGLIAVWIAFFMLADSRNNWREFRDNPEYWWLTANFVLLIHLSAMLSTYLRWGAFAMSIAVTLVMMFLTQTFLSFVLRPVPLMVGNSHFLVELITILVLVLCLICHLVILLRLPALGEK